MNITVKRVVMVAIFSALTTLLYILVKFPLPIFPSFLDINISMIPVIICAFVLGPIDASICVLMRFLIKLPMTSTMYVGELADLIMGLGTCLPCAFIYKTNWKYKTLIAFISVPVMWVCLGIITNSLDPILKVAAIGNMWVGRLEIFPILVTLAGIYKFIKK